MSLLKSLKVDRLTVDVYPSRLELGFAAGQEIADCLRQLLSEKDEVNIMFAAAPSQAETLQTLREQRDIDWTRVNAFHMDEYLGLPDDNPASFRHFLQQALFSQLPFKAVHLLNGDAAIPTVEAKRYEVLLRQSGLDICVLGVGENGHIAFNDPPAADLNDSQYVRIVRLADRCRRQQVHDGCFTTLEQVPRWALSVTVPGLIRAQTMFCVVPSQSKAHAVRQMLCQPVSSLCPASVLRNHPHAKLYLDPDSAKEFLIANFVEMPTLDNHNSTPL